MDTETENAYEETGETEPETNVADDVTEAETPVETAPETAPETEPETEPIPPMGMRNPHFPDYEDERRKRVYLENKIVCLGELSKRGLPAELADWLTGDDSAETEARIGSFAEILSNLVNAEISKRLDTITPKKAPGSRPSRTAFDAMTLSERQELYRRDRDGYLALAVRKNRN